MWWSLLKCGTWHGLARGKLISGFTQHKKSRFKGTRLRRAHTNSTFIGESFEVQYNRLCMGVESPKQIFGVVGNLRRPALAGRAGRAQGLELNIQICPKPPTHYPKKVWLKVRLLSRGSSMRCNYYKCKILPPQLNTKMF